LTIRLANQYVMLRRVVSREWICCICCSQELGVLLPTTALDLHLVGPNISSLVDSRVLRPHSTVTVTLHCGVYHALQPVLPAPHLIIGKALLCLLLKWLCSSFYIVCCTSVGAVTHQTVWLSLSVKGSAFCCAGTCTIVPVPRNRLGTFGHRAFSIAGPTAWNSLPDPVRNLNVTEVVFGRLLKDIPVRMVLAH